MIVEARYRLPEPFVCKLCGVRPPAPCLLVCLPCRLEEYGRDAPVTRHGDKRGADPDTLFRGGGVTMAADPFVRRFYQGFRP